METCGILIGVVAIAIPITLIILSVIHGSRLRELQKQVDELRTSLGKLMRQVDGVTPAHPAPAPKPASAVPEKWPAAPSLSAHPLPPPAKPVPTPERGDEQDRLDKLKTAIGRPVTKECAGAGEPPPVLPPPAPPPCPPAPSRAPYPVPAPSPLNWEALLGMRGAAWVGAVALVIAGILFAKYSFEHDLITPATRVAIMTLAGISLLVGCEFILRKGYSATANALSGAGILLLYTAFYVAHGIYHLFPMIPAFALMAMVTATAVLLSIRYNAMFIAILGLLGGFSTPLLLSTGENRPFGLFSYIFLIDIGLLVVATRKGWTAIALLSLAATLLMEALWFGKFMTPTQMWTGTAILAVFATLYLLLPRVAGPTANPALLRGGALGGLAPFLFAFWMAGQSAYAGEWPLLFGMIALLDIALILVALRQAQAWLVPCAAGATMLTTLLWASLAGGLTRETAWGGSLAVIGLATIFNLAPRLARRLSPISGKGTENVLEISALLSCAGSGIYFLILSSLGLGEPPWISLVLLVAFISFVVERSPRDWLKGIVPVAGMAIAALLAQIWFFQSTHEETLFRNLSLPMIVAFAASAAAIAFRRKPAAQHEGGAVAAAFIPMAGLLLCARHPELGRTPWPIFAADALLSILVVGIALRRGWTVLLFWALTATSGTVLVWNHAFFRPSDAATVLPWYAAFYIAALVLPFLIPRDRAPAWQIQPWPWVSSALAGPLFFHPLYLAVTSAWGKAYIGALPLGMAVFTVLALSKVRSLFLPSAGDKASALRRLRTLALFSAVALGFITLAIPLQLDRQWITVAFALEGAAVWWLYRPLPHPALKYFGAGLFLTVAIRLLANPFVLHYEARGMPILNWILYTYATCATACFVGARGLKPVEADRLLPREQAFFRNWKFSLASCASVLGLFLIFALINLEIADYFSSGRYLEIRWEREATRDVTTSTCWGLYALTLLAVGMGFRNRSLRFLSLGFMLLTVGKVFLYDLASLTGLYRVFSFLGLAVSLILVSLLYRRFVFRGTEPESGEEPARAPEGGSPP